MKEIEFKEREDFMAYINKYMSGASDVRQSGMTVHVVTSDGRLLAEWSAIGGGIVRELRKDPKGRGKNV